MTRKPPCMKLFTSLLETTAPAVKRTTAEKHLGVARDTNLKKKGTVSRISLDRFYFVIAETLLLNFLRFLSALKYPKPSVLLKQKIEKWQSFIAMV